ncbi:MAG: methylenetetrahydrofolate reductase [NAD(P)H] [Alphaproteobacteria bacterium]|nr:MAG: methylenetetrahydrofolate reductase [NAD(P)H] [Alphaproteobacteria bacterium]
MSKATFSFEFFPPKTDKTTELLFKAIEDLKALNPKFMTVTYGAGGSTRDKTLQIIKRMIADTDIPTASHLTYINSPRKEMYALADELWENGVHHIVALRGDMPADLEWPLDPDAEYFQYTSHFVAALKARQDFEISVGAYPEKHPDADSMDKDVEALMKKVDAGANRAITQFFFDNNVYYEFLEHCEKANIKAPIVPGLLPIHDFKSMCGFAGRCQASVPKWLHERFSGLEDKPEDARKVALDLLVGQSEDLVKNGVEHIHYYTLNKSDITTQAVEAIS